MPPDALTPPIPPRRPHEIEFHRDVRVDDWHWLRDREDPLVSAHLEAENAYTERALAHTAPLQERLYAEFLSRIQETDLSVPSKFKQHWYYSRTVEGLQYGISCRRAGSVDGPEQVLLDQNELAGTSEYFALGAHEVSPDERLLAFSTDFEGDEIFTIRVKDLETGELLSDTIAGASYGATWATDGQTLFYVVQDAAHRPWRLMRHRLGSDPATDVLVYQEDDERFSVSSYLTKDERYLVLSIDSDVTSEAWILEADRAEEEFRLVEPREYEIEYGVEHLGGRFLITTNIDGATNFKLVETPDDQPAREHWRDIVPHDPNVKLSGVDVFANHLALHERADGLRRIRIVDVHGGSPKLVDQPEEVSTCTGAANLELDTQLLRYAYTSMVTPASIYEYDMVTGERTLLKQTPVLGDFDPARYTTARTWATAADGTKVPVSYVHHRSTPLDGTAPGVLYGYGSYEASMDPGFSIFRLSLLDRGMVFAIAHVRGGGEMGRPWYEQGRRSTKTNTFTDFIACADHLVEEGVVGRDRLVARGASAGGLLMGAVANLRPELFTAIVAEVPFVDALTTMCDPSLPLTAGEWDEWGNPIDDPEVYAYMKRYSPYDNVAAADYPSMLVTTGFNDPRVGYWEPAKWVAKLRATKTDRNPILLKVEMGAGHGGPSGRYDAWREEALILAFIIDRLGLEGDVVAAGAAAGNT